MQIGNYSESSEINMSLTLCPNYLDRFMMLSTRKLPVRPVIRTNICFFPISRQVYYADIQMYEWIYGIIQNHHK